MKEFVRNFIRGDYFGVLVMVLFLGFVAVSSGLTFLGTGQAKHIGATGFLLSFMLPLIVFAVYPNLINIFRRK